MICQKDESVRACVRACVRVRACMHSWLGVSRDKSKSVDAYDSHLLALCLLLSFLVCSVFSLLAFAPVRRYLPNVSPSGVLLDGFLSSVSCTTAGPGILKRFYAFRMLVVVSALFFSFLSPMPMAFTANRSCLEFVTACVCGCFSRTRFKCNFTVVKTPLYCTGK